MENIAEANGFCRKIFAKYTETIKSAGKGAADIGAYSGAGGKRSTHFICEIKKDHVFDDLFTQIDRLSANSAMKAKAKLYPPYALVLLQQEVQQLRSKLKNDDDTNTITTIMSTYESVQAAYLQTVRYILAIDTTHSPNPDNPKEAEISRYGCLATSKVVVFFKVDTVPVLSERKLDVKVHPRRLHIFSTRPIPISSQDDNADPAYPITISQRIIACITAAAHSAPHKSHAQHPTDESLLLFTKEIEAKLTGARVFRHISGSPAQQLNPTVAATGTGSTSGPTGTVQTLASLCSQLPGVFLPSLPDVDPGHDDWPLHLFYPKNQTRTQLVFKLNSADPLQTLPLYALKMALKGSQLYKELVDEGSCYNQFKAHHNSVVPLLVYQGEVFHNNLIYYALITPYSGVTLREYATDMKNSLRISSESAEMKTRDIAESDLKKSILLAATSSLSQFHKMNLVHGDIKSDNLLVSRDANGIKVMFIDLTHVKSSPTSASLQIEQTKLVTLIQDMFNMTSEELAEYLN